MNYYIVDSNTENCSKLKEVIEADFDSNVIGISDDANRAYEEVIQLHVDIMIVAYEINQRHQGIELIQKLRKVGSKPHFVMTGHNLTSQEKHQIYSHGIEVIINTPVEAVEARQMLHLLASYANNLFEYKNIHNEMEALESEKCAKVEISLQHFFNGLLEESKRVQK